jgi:hypothetical protein
MIPVPDATRLGRSLADVRQMLGMSRREAARRIAEMTGRSETSVNAQLYSWECEPGTRYHRQPDLASLVPYMVVLGIRLGIDFEEDEDEEAQREDQRPDPVGGSPGRRAVVEAAAGGSDAEAVGCARGAGPDARPGSQA